MFDLEKMCIFATAYARDVSIARKALRYCPIIEIGKISIRRTEHFAFACCVCYFLSIPSGVRFVPWKKPDGFLPVPERCLPIPDNNGHEHISLMPFLFV